VSMGRGEQPHWGAKPLPGILVPGPDSGSLLDTQPGKRRDRPVPPLSPHPSLWH